MKTSILIIGSDKKWEEEQLLIEAKKLGFAARFIVSDSITIFLKENNAQLFCGDENITALFYKSKIIFRRTRGNVDKMFSLANLADAGYKAVYTDSVQSIMNNLNKIHSMHLAVTKHIKHIPTVFIIENEIIDTDFFNLPFPLLIKPACGRHGEGIHFFENKAALDKFLSANNEPVLLQAALDIDHEYRVFVLGNQCLGVVEKIPEEGSRIANYAAGAQFIQAGIDKKYIQDAIEICRQKKIDIAGVDIAYAGGNYYLLEVNRCPEFKAFTKATGINAAEKIINFVNLKK